MLHPVPWSPCYSLYPEFMDADLNPNLIEQLVSKNHASDKLE